MNLIGIEKVVYGLEDLDQCKSFWRDFGLSVIEDDEQHGLFARASGAKVEVRSSDDPSLPPPVVAEPTVRETILGCELPGYGGHDWGRIVQRPGRSDW